MKKIIKHAVMAFFLIITSQNIWAYDFEKDGICYEYLIYENHETIDTVVAVTYYSQEDYYNSNFYSGNVVIPENVSYEGLSYSVISISSGAFYGCTGLTSVTIPNTVTDIGYQAFRDCTGLSSVTIPNSITSLGLDVFLGCTGIKTFNIGNSLDTYTITSLCSYSTSLIEVNVADDNPNCKSIDGVLFSIGADTLFLYPNGRQGDYSIPNTVTCIDKAFLDCTGLTSVTIPNSVTTIGRFSFCGCTGLTFVTIPSSITSIGKSAFIGCTGLTSVTIPSSVTSLGECAFAGCTGLTSFFLPNSITTIENGTFAGDCSLIYVFIPNSVTTIGTKNNIHDGAFSGCINLSNITIPNSVTCIGGRAFSNCTGLTSISIPNSVESLGVQAFYGCTGLTSVVIPSSVESIGHEAFFGCENLKTVMALGNIPPTLGVNESPVFDTENNQLFVRCGCGNAYRNSAWNQNFSSIEESCDSHTITVIEETQPGGSVSTSLNEANLGDEVEINITTTPGYAIRSILVFNVIDNTQTVPTYKKSETATSQTFAFSMPAYNVKVYADIRPSGLAIEEQNSVAINIFPNPTNSSVTIEAENMQRICVYNIMGQKVLDNATTGNKFECDMRSYNKGVYLILIETGKGIKTKQLIVE